MGRIGFSSADACWVALVTCYRSTFSSADVGDAVGGLLMGQLHGIGLLLSSGYVLDIGGLVYGPL